MPRLKELAAKKTKKTAREGRKRKTPAAEDESLPLDPLPIEHEALPAEHQIPAAPKQKGVVINEPAPPTPVTSAPVVSKGKGVLVEAPPLRKKQK